MYSNSDLQKQYDQRHLCWYRAFARAAGINLDATLQPSQEISADEFRSLKSALESELNCIQSGLLKAKEGNPTCDLDSAVNRVRGYIQKLTNSDNLDYAQYGQEKQGESQSLLADAQRFTLSRFRGFDSGGAYIEVPFNATDYQTGGWDDKYLTLQRAFDENSGWISDPKLQEWITKFGLKETALIVKEQLDNGKRFSL